MSRLVASAVQQKHAHIAHTRRADFQNRGDEVDARHQRADAGDLQRPQIVVGADPGRVLQLAERRIIHPTGLGKLANEQ
jgi:hypothetical protein